MTLSMTLRQLVQQIDKGKMPKDYPGIFEGQTFTNLRFARMGTKRNLWYVEFERNGKMQMYDSSQMIEIINGDLAFVLQD